MSSDNGAAVLSRNGTAVGEPPAPHLHPPTVLAEARTEASVTVIAGPTVSDQVRQLMEQINRAPARTMSSKAQDEMARIVKLLPDLVAKNDPYLTDSAKLAVTGLLEGDPSICFARSIRRNIECQVARWRTPLRAMYRGRPPMRATLGLLVFAAVALVVSVLARAVSMKLSPGMAAVAGSQGVDGTLLYGAAAMGAIGSIVSVFVRVPRMSADFRDADPEVPFFVGLLKPMVGIAFAAFAYLAIEGGLLPIDVGDSPGAFYMAISFVAGFSERFVPDIINKAERHGAGAPTP